MTKGKSEFKRCGIIMPIAAMHGYTADHWQEVKGIIIEATEQVEGYQFNTEIVSNSDGEIDVIHKRIIQNIYNADIVVCDISGKNPNVLFELGMRLTFDKPTILIKDDQTDFIFDTGVIEHITYPKDLRFNKVVQFKSELAARIKQTYEKSLNDPNFSTFLRNFGTFKVPQLDQTAVSDVNQLIFEEVNTLRKELMSFKKEVAGTKSNSTSLMGMADLITLNEIIYSYVTENTDFEEPSIVAKKEEFRSYLHTRFIDPYQIPPSVLRKSIKEAQDRALPF
ncbi:hypothetical protein MKZ02_21145 [Pseudobacillus sp. FSL P4-0506]|uniref:hypothetical protein n=1 Tax=Pseudobacillus sp. FSL P4-0506 TaxID=2921576 RepID=UPI0030FC3FA6